MSLVHGQPLSRSRMRLRPVRTSRPAAAKARSRSRFGSATASSPCRARRYSRAVSSWASMTICSQTALAAACL
jgi:hypothetical protein